MTIPEQADIVERLRDWEDYEPAKMFGGEILKDTKEAADEIERQRTWRAEHPYSEIDMDMHVEAVTKELRAEIERLNRLILGVHATDRHGLECALALHTGQPQEGETEAIIKNYRAAVAQAADILVRAEAAETVALAALASPRAEGELTPHPYVPSTLHMGDCAACGHLQSAAVHSLVAEKRPEVKP